MILALVFVACSKQQDGSTTTSESEQYEMLRRNVAAMLGEEPDRAFIVLDSLENAESYPVCVLNLIRGNMYGQMMSLRFAEFYLRKAICQELHDEWPRGYYMGIYNLGLTLQEKSNMEEALKVAEEGYEGGGEGERPEAEDLGDVAAICHRWLPTETEAAGRG